MTGELTSRPWRSAEPIEVPDAPATMLSDEEIALLRWLGANRFTGEGTIVDAGCFLGGSTHALASGVASSGVESARARPIVSYDRFIVEEEPEIYTGGTYEGVRAGESFRPTFEKNISRFADRVEIHEGDICAQPWDGGLIEILFVDVAKTEAVHDHLVQSFFPALAPGRSVVVQQDFLWCSYPWIVATMEHFKDYFEVLDDMPWATRVYLYKKAIPAEVLRGFRIASLPVEERARLLDRALETVPDDYQGMLYLSKAALYDQAGDRALTARMLLDVSSRFPDSMARSKAPAFFPDYYAPASLLPYPDALTQVSLDLVSQLSPDERLLTYALVCGLRPGRILEIGRARGGSTVLFASALGHIGSGVLVSMDPNVHAEHTIQPALKEKLEASGRVRFLDEFSPYANGKAVAMADGLFDFVFIDADHTREAVLRDIVGALPFMVVGGYLLLHDDHYAGVSEAVDEALGTLPLADCGSLVTEKHSGFAHILYKGQPSYYRGLRLLRSVAADRPPPAATPDPVRPPEWDRELAAAQRQQEALAKRLRQVEKELERAQNRRVGTKLRRSWKKRFGG
ncbi:hypothetical protein BH23VER1_BH23VER1_20000 [soil metagenome]